MPRSRADEPRTYMARCGSCRRHVAIDETACPFCGADALGPLGFEIAPSQRPDLPPPLPVYGGPPYVRVTTWLAVLLIPAAAIAGLVALVWF